MSAHGGRRKKHGGHENHERWLLTYADMITLLVAFFIMLYAMSVTNQAKFVKLALSVRSGFGNVAGAKPSILNGGVGTQPTPKLMTRYTPETPHAAKTQTSATGGAAGGQTGAGEATSVSAAAAKAKAISEDISQAIQKGKLGDHVSVKVDEQRGIVITILADKYTFESGSDALRPALEPVLKDIANQIKPLPNPVRVEGHTDNLPIHNAEFRSNWQLSAMRAANVCSYLIDSGACNPDRFSSDGYGDTRPVDDNGTDEGRAHNRRVEIVILENFDNSIMDTSAGSGASDSIAPLNGDLAPGGVDIRPEPAVFAPGHVAPNPLPAKESTTQSKPAVYEAPPTHFKVTPFMPKIDLKGTH